MGIKESSVKIMNTETSILLRDVGCCGEFQSVLIKDNFGMITRIVLKRYDNRIKTLCLLVSAVRPNLTAQQPPDMWPMESQ